MELFRTAREWNLKLIGSLSEVELVREMTHPERGTMTFQNVVETMAGHDLNHLAQVQGYLARAGSCELAPYPSLFHAKSPEDWE